MLVERILAVPFAHEQETTRVGARCGEHVARAPTLTRGPALEPSRSAASSSRRPLIPNISATAITAITRSFADTDEAAADMQILLASAPRSLTGGVPSLSLSAFAFATREAVVGLVRGRKRDGIRSMTGGVIPPAPRRLRACPTPG